MIRPLILDLFSGAGGAAKGYHQAGFDVVGVDNAPQRRYPFPFAQADAIATITALLAGDWLQTPSGAYCLADLAAIHASPVCKLFSSATPAWARANHTNYITPLRPLLNATGLPWVMENVPGAPLRPDFKICGCQVGLAELERERWFETNWFRDLDFRPPCYHATSPITVAGHGEPSGPRLARNERATVVDWRRVMGIDWMTRDELAQAIPPAYTEHIGRLLLEHIEAAA